MTQTQRPSSEILERLKQVVGAKGWKSKKTEIEPYLREWRDRYFGSTPIVLSPSTASEVCEIVRICAETCTSLVPQGGNTGAVGGQIPSEDNSSIVVLLHRLNKVLAVDPLNNTLTTQAGVTLAQLQQVADEHNRLFPLSLASEGSCQIGGNIATNAGGTAVLRYGNARDLVLGLEVVLPDGTLWNGLRGLRKDNTGYDLKQMFIGAEGTLGIITAAVLKLFPKPGDVQTAFVGFQGLEEAVSTLALAQELTGHQVTTFELIPKIGIDIVTEFVDGARNPLSTPFDWYGLIEISFGSSNMSRELTEKILSKCLEQNLIGDAVLAESGAQSKAFWQLRESLSEAQKNLGGSIKHDVSVPVPAVPALIERSIEAANSFIPGIRPVPFGHIGDGNIHLNFTQPPDMDRDAYLAKWEDLNNIIHDIVNDLGGSISAEHGLGQMKVDEIVRYKTQTEMDLMRQIKRALDPKNIMNPGKVIEV